MLESGKSPAEAVHEQNKGAYVAVVSPKHRDDDRDGDGGEDAKIGPSNAGSPHRIVDRHAAEDAREMYQDSVVVTSDKTWATDGSNDAHCHAGLPRTSILHSVLGTEQVSSASSLTSVSTTKSAISPIDGGSIALPPPKAINIPAEITSRHASPQQSFASLPPQQDGHSGAKKDARIAAYQSPALTSGESIMANPLGRQKSGQMPALPPANQPKRATPGQLKKSAQARTSSH